MFFSDYSRVFSRGELQPVHFRLFQMKLSPEHFLLRKVHQHTLYTSQTRIFHRHIFFLPASQHKSVKSLEIDGRFMSNVMVPAVYCVEGR